MVQYQKRRNAMWVVQLIRPPRIDDIRFDCFPRKFRFRVDAQRLVEEVKQMGGEAQITKARISMARASGTGAAPGSVDGAVMAQQGDRGTGQWGDSTAAARNIEPT